MGRCGCSSGCACVIGAGDCIVVGGNGAPGAPYLISVEVDPDVTNQLACGVDGLFVPGASVEVADSDCIDLSGTGFPGDPIIATPALDPAAGNILTCGVAGLLADVVTADTNCIDLAGQGTIASPLTAAPLISTDIGNTFECRADGMYVPSTTQGAIDYRATVIHDGTLGQTILAPAAIATESETFIDYDYTEEAVGLVVDIGGAGAGYYAHTYIEVPVGGAGIYLIQATHPGWSAGAISAGDMILRLRLWRGDTTGRVADGIGQCAQTRYTTSATSYNTPYLHISRTIELFDADCVAVSFVAEDYNGLFAGATLNLSPQYGAGAGGVNSETAGYSFFQMTRLGDA